MKNRSKWNKTKGQYDKLIAYTLTSNWIQTHTHSHTHHFSCCIKYIEPLYERKMIKRQKITETNERNEKKKLKCNTQHNSVVLLANNHNNRLCAREIVWKTLSQCMPTSLVPLYDLRLFYVERNKLVSLVWIVYFFFHFFLYDFLLFVFFDFV